MSEEHKAIVTITWKYGTMDVNVSGNLSLDSLNLACDMIKNTILKQMIKDKPVGFTPRVLP